MLKIGFANLLTLLFVAAKLFNYIDWSWWWVTAPTWGSLAIALAFVGLFMAGAVVATLGARARL